MMIDTAPVIEVVLALIIAAAAWTGGQWQGPGDSGRVECDHDKPRQIFHHGHITRWTAGNIAAELSTLSGGR